MHVQLSEERRKALAVALQDFCSQGFEEELSDYRAERLVEFFVQQLGPTVYNQAIQDARGFVQEKLSDLEGEFYEPSS